MKTTYTFLAKRTMKATIKVLFYIAISTGFLFISCKNDDLSFACDQTLVFDMDLFIEKINDNLQSTSIAGYQFAVNQNGNLYHSEAFGFARHQNDPGGEISMTTTTRQNVASVSKFIGAIALMKAMEENFVSVEFNVVNYLPETWRPLVHPDFTNVDSPAYLTFDRLLTMNTAIDFIGSNPCPPNGGSGSALSEADMLASLQRAPDLCRIGEYQNANFNLIRVLIGEIVYNLDETSIGYFIDCSDFYFKYLRDNIFDPLNIYAPLSLLAVEDYYDNTNYPFGYQWPFNPNFQAPNDGTLGWQHTNNPLNAGSSGLTLSSLDLAKLLAFFKYDDQGLIISSTQREKIFTRELGLTTTFHNRVYGTYYAKNGAKSNDCSGCGRALRSVVMFFPNDVEIALLVNYNLRNPGLGSTLANIYEDSYVNPCD